MKAWIMALGVMIGFGAASAAPKGGELGSRCRAEFEQECGGKCVLINKACVGPQVAGGKWRKGLFVTCNRNKFYEFESIARAINKSLRCAQMPYI